MAVGVGVLEGIGALVTAVVGVMAGDLIGVGVGELVGVGVAGGAGLLTTAGNEFTTPEFIVGVEEAAGKLETVKFGIVVVACGELEEDVEVAVFTLEVVVETVVEVVGTVEVVVEASLVVEVACVELACIELVEAVEATEVVVFIWLFKT